MSKKLFKVDFFGNIYVLANDKKEAKRIAAYNINEEIQNFNIETTEVNESKNVESEWLDCIPYYNPYQDSINKVTCKKFLEDQNAESKKQ